MQPFMSPYITGRRALGLVILLTLPLLIAACSGGGQMAAPGLPVTTTAPPASPPPPPPVGYNTAEYRQNWGLDAVSAIQAYNAGYTGKGVTVAVIDTGIDVNNPELSANLAPASTNVVSNSRANLQDTDGHGTAVAGVVAAVRNGTGTEGVAFDATLLAINASDSPACGTSCSFFQSDLALGIDYARLHGAKIINLSMGGPAVGVGLEQAMRQAVTAGMIIVISAGNDSAATPSDFARIAEAGWTNGQIIVAGASNQLNQMASFSNKAGALGQNHYLIAPGSLIQTTQLGGGIYTGSGTSFSAPLVAGAMAILYQEFPNLTAQQITTILLTTATDLGVAGVDDVYGYGLLNMARAIAPIGPASIPTGGSSSPTSGGGLVSSSAIHLSAAFGDALSRSAALGNAMILDSYRRSYRMDLTSRIRLDPSLPDLLALTEPGHRSITRDILTAHNTHLQLAADQNTAFAEVDARYFANTDPKRQHPADLRWRLTQKFNDRLSLEAASHMALEPGLAADNANLFLTRPESRNSATGKSDDLSAALTSRLTGSTSLAVTAAYSTSHDKYFQLDAWQSTAAARLTQSLGSKINLSLDLGISHEKGSVLGAMSSGAMALGDGAVTRYVGLGMTWSPAPKIQLFGQWTSGQTRVEAAANSLFQNLSALHSQSFRAGLAASGVLDEADRLGLMISQPLRVTGGQARLMLATARDYANDRLTFEAQDTNLSPSGREVDLEASYQFALSQSLWMQTMLLHQINPGHVAGGASQTLGLMRLTTAF